MAGVAAQASLSADFKSTNSNEAQASLEFMSDRDSSWSLLLPYCPATNPFQDPFQPVHTMGNLTVHLGKRGKKREQTSNHTTCQKSLQPVP
jgi:hypothetical protein